MGHERRAVRSHARALVLSVVASAGAVACTSPPAPTGGDASAASCTSSAECDDGAYCNGAETCMPGMAGADARGCLHASPCLDSQRCDEAQDRCVTSCAVEPDADGDGADAIECGGADCDDTDAMAHPGASEVCDPIDRDEDCDPSTFGDRDADGDGFFDATCCNPSRSGGMPLCGTDCNDVRRDAHPGATEACDGFDNDCDGTTDESLLVPSYPDADRDLHGATGASSDRCPGAPGWSTVSDDCDDTSALRHGAQLEICDAIDNDCDGTTDEAPVSIPWFVDADGDGFGDATSDVVVSCAPVPGRSARSSDCDDGDAHVSPLGTELCNGIDDDCNGRADAPGTRAGDTEDDDGDGVADVVCGGSDCDDARGAVYPGADELCNGIDDDCDGMVDGDSASANWYLDLDHDGFGDASSAPIVSCDPQAGRVTRGGDCDDGDASVHPRAADLCDDEDTDCDGQIDENGIRFAFFPDADADGWGTSDRSSIVFRCAAPAGTSARTGDCADTDDTRHPIALEQCQGADDDCDGMVDEASDRMWFVDVDGDGHGVGAGIAACMAPTGRAPLGDDCDDADPGNFPGNTEACNGQDDDCDGTVDDGADAACTGPHATGTCTSGHCALACTGTYEDCNASPADGCEVDTDHSVVHCGSCGAACGPADSCGITAAGSCDLAPVVLLDGHLQSMIALRSTGGVAGWGSAASARTTLLGDTSSPLASSLGDVADLGVGGTVGCAVTTSRRLYCWGANNNGQLGIGTTSGGSSGPVLVPLQNVVDVDATDTSVAAILADGTVWTWGHNGSGQLGSATPSQRTSPAQVAGIGDALAVAGMTGTFCVLRGVSGGATYVTCFGSNVNGECGLGATSPATVSPPAGNVLGLPGDVRALSRGYAGGVCAITRSGAAYCWGYNQPFSSTGWSLGLGGSAPTPAVTTATQMPVASEVVDVVLNGRNGCLQRRNGGAQEIWCWGLDGGWLDGVSSSPVPVRVGGTIAGGLSDVVSIGVGNARWCAARAGGGVVCQGDDGSGGLGNGPPLTASASPVTVLGLP